MRFLESTLVFDGNRDLAVVRVWAVWRNSGATPATGVHGPIGATFVANERGFQFGVADSGGQVSLSIAGLIFWRIIPGGDHGL